MVSEHHLDSLLRSLAVFTFAALVLALAIALFRAAELSQGYRRTALCVSCVLALLVGIGASDSGDVVSGALAALVAFAVTLLISVRLSLDLQNRMSTRDLARQFWWAHVEAGEDVGEDWLYQGKIYHFGVQDLEWKRKQLSRQWPAMLKRIRGTLENLSLTPDKQRAYLAKFGAPLDVADLSLGFDDDLDKLPPMVDVAFLSPHQAELVRDVGRKLSQLSEDGDPDDWSVDALDRSREWSEVRELARHALEELPSAAVSGARRRH